MRTFTFLLVLSGLISCSNETENLKIENQRIQAQNDSLTTELQKYKLIPYLQPLQFETALNDTFYTKALLVQENGLVIDSLKIEGLTEIETKEMVELVASDHGTGINFNATKPGTFELEMFARVSVWNDKVVPLKIPVTVTEETK
jgi:hypothetical protein